MRLSFSPGQEWKPNEKLRPERSQERGESGKWGIEWKSSLEGQKEGTRGIIEEYLVYAGKMVPLACYIPYSYKKNDWGIYLIEPTIMRSVHKLEQMYPGITPVYFMLIFFHELAHHVIEDWRTSTGVYLAIEDDEALAEYTAFELTEAILSMQGLTQDVFTSQSSRAIGGLIYDLLPKAQSAWPSARGYGIGYPTPGFVSDYFTALLKKFPLNLGRANARDILSVIYYYWNRDTNPIYRPKVPSWVIETHYVFYLTQNLLPGLDAMWDDKGLESIYDRVFVIHNSTTCPTT